MLADWFIPTGEPESQVMSSSPAPSMHCIVGAFPSILVWFSADFVRLTVWNGWMDTWINKYKRRQRSDGQASTYVPRCFCFRPWKLRCIRTSVPFIMGTVEILSIQPLYWHSSRYFCHYTSLIKIVLDNKYRMPLPWHSMDNIYLVCVHLSSSCTWWHSWRTPWTATRQISSMLCPARGIHYYYCILFHKSYEILICL